MSPGCCWFRRSCYRLTVRDEDGNKMQTEQSVSTLGLTSSEVRGSACGGGADSPSLCDASIGRETSCRAFRIAPVAASIFHIWYLRKQMRPDLEKMIDSHVLYTEPNSFLESRMKKHSDTGKAAFNQLHVWSNGLKTPMNLCFSSGAPWQQPGIRFQFILRGMVVVIF